MWWRFSAETGSGMGAGRMMRMRGKQEGLSHCTSAGRDARRRGRIEGGIGWSDDVRCLVGDQLLLREWWRYDCPLSSWKQPIAGLLAIMYIGMPTLINDLQLVHWGARMALSGVYRPIRPPSAIAEWRHGGGGWCFRRSWQRLGETWMCAVI